MMITVSIVMAPGDTVTMTAEEMGQKIMDGLGASPPEDTCTVNVMHNPESATIGPETPQVNPLTEATIPPPPSGPPPSLE